MSIDQITAEQEALESLMKLLEQAKKCQHLYTRAHMTFPEPLKRVLGMNGAGRAVMQNIGIPAPEAPPAPSGSKNDWIWIRKDAATPTSIALAILRDAKTPIRAKDIVAKVTAILPQVPRGSINNIGSRLDGKLIERAEDGWRLIRRESAPILHEDHLWGPTDVFHKSELAEHRRQSILHILEFSPGGYQLRQILDQLKRCGWVHAPVNKDLLKADLEVLDKAEKIRRIGNSGKWELAMPKAAKASSEASR